MRHGIYKGYNPGCGDGLEIWGVAGSMPAFESWRGDSSNQNIFSYKDLPYDLQGPINSQFFGDSYSSEIIPEKWGRNVGQEWYLYAAKVPGTYPACKDCGERPTSSSGVEQGSNEWQYNLGMAARHYLDQTQNPARHVMAHSLHVFGSRAIYIDGQQTHVAYAVGAKQLQSYPPVTQGKFQYADLHIIDINQRVDINGPNMVGEYIALGTMNNKLSTTVNTLNEVTAMEYNLLFVLGQQFNGMMRNVTNSNIISGGNAFGQVGGLRQPPTNNICYGLEYGLFSSYAPGKENWSVGRIKYDVVPYQVVFTQIYQTGGGFDTEHLGHPQTSVYYNKNFNRDWWVVLPSCRTYIDSNKAGTDECWVLAIHKDSLYYTEDNETFERTYPNAKKMKVGQWLNSETKTGINQNQAAASYSTGSLSTDEANAGTVILDSSISTGPMSHVKSAYPDESWNRIEVRCYNRIYDSSTDSHKHLALFTTQDDVGLKLTPEGEDIIADFAGGDLNSGLEEAEIKFSTGGFNETDAWISSSSSAKATAQDVTLENNIFLKLTFSLVSDGYVTFDYLHDNRKYGTRIPPFVELTNQAEVDNYLDIRLDGSLVSGTKLVGPNQDIPQFQINLTDTNLAGTFTPISTSRIDNVTSPKFCTAEDDYITWRAVKIWMTKGTHTLSWTQRRQWQDNGHMLSRIDNLILGRLMVGEDTSGKKRWLYNGEKVQKAEWWAWPHYDEEKESSLTQRVSTAPDYITLDKEGRILYGNPHYVCRLIPDENNEGLFKLDTSFGRDRGVGPDATEGGFIRFTGTFTTKTVGEFQLPTCDNPDLDYENQEIISDPPWGAFQILPFGDDGDFQVRGVNAAIRDATTHPFGEFDYPLDAYSNNNDGYEYFSDNKLKVSSSAGSWQQRLHSWTITSNGTVLRPHCTVIWRPTLHSPAFPVDPDEMTAANGFPNWFENGRPPIESFLYDYWGARRPHDPMRLGENSRLGRWTKTNTIVSTTFSDSLLHIPQGVWIRNPTDIPGPDDFWDVQIDGSWPANEWLYIQTQFVPTARFYRIFWDGPGLNARLINEEEVCGEDDDGPIRSLVYKIFGLSNQGQNTDFDVVDTDCNCCD